jgi:hypothetical protein
LTLLAGGKAYPIETKTQLLLMAKGSESGMIGQVMCGFGDTDPETGKATESYEFTPPYSAECH